MAEPTIVKQGRFEFAKVRMNGVEDRLGVREGAHLPWIFLGDLTSIAYGLYLPLTIQAEWVDFKANPGAVLSGLTIKDGIVLSSRAKGASFRSASPSTGRPRDILVGTLEFYNTLLSYPDITDMSAFLASLITDPSIFESWVPVDADSSEISKSVNYGKA